MQRAGIRLRSSLAFRVILSTVLLSLSVVWLTGSTLNNQLSKGIRQVNLDSAIIEARSTFFNVQYRLALAQGQPEPDIRRVIIDAITSATSIGTTENARQIAFLESPGQKDTKLNYEIKSEFLKEDSVPENFKIKVRKSSDIKWMYSSFAYPGNVSTPVIILADKVKVPNAGQYEMYLFISLANQNTTLELIRSSLLLTGFVLILLIGLITWLVVRQVVRPVREAARIATEFTSGDFHQRMDVNSRDEISTLGSAFNEMAESLQKQIARLENLSRVQQRFVSDVSHELRTPLTTLRMASEIINSARQSFEPNVTRSAELLVAQLDRFERLLEDLLEVSRFDAEVAVLEGVDFDIVTLAKRCIEDLALVASENSTSIVLLVPDEMIMLNADIRRVERILRNLLTNAIDHAGGKPIEITIVHSEHDVAVGVRDYGIGIEPHLLSRVFDRFWRADPSRARVRGGTGLGLSIALEDARLHNGELEAWGRPLYGAHFVLTLPRTEGSSIETRLITLKPTT
jgi:two-component system sensor histidine kinase MtrB